MKKLIFFTILLFIGFEVYYYKDAIYEYILLNFVFKDSFVVSDHNEYRLENNFNYVQITDSYKPKNRQDILNIIYSGLNNGWTEFSYFCPRDYENCIEDSKDITDNNSIVSLINNFVHPYNSFSTIKISINNLGKITINVDKMYSDEDIKAINQKVDEIYNQYITEDMTIMDKIKTIHDYIINTTQYDVERANNIQNPGYVSKNKSQNAYGVLFDGYGICGGYADAMAIFLDKMGVLNYKVSSDNHVWNLVNIGGNWFHLDLTWDDPVVNTHENLLLYNYYMITTEQLKELDATQHVFNKGIFSEAN